MKNIQRTTHHVSWPKSHTSKYDFLGALVMHLGKGLCIHLGRQYHNTRSRLPFRLKIDDLEAHMNKTTTNIELV